MFPSENMKIAQNVGMLWFNDRALSQSSLHDENGRELHHPGNFSHLEECLKYGGSLCSMVSRRLQYANA